MLPADWRLKLVDLDVTALEDADIDWADWIMLSGMIIHTDSCRTIAARCAARGKSVIAGGPLFTTGHEQFPEIPHFVLGEAEDVMPALVADMIRRHRPRPLRVAAEAGCHPDTHSALGSRPVQGLRHGARAVLSRLPVRLRVLRHPGDVRSDAAREDGGAGDPRAGRAHRGGLARVRLHRRRQLHRAQDQGEGAAPRADRLAEPSGGAISRS